MYTEGRYSTGIAYLLWLVSGFGILGFHRFYLGKFGTGILWALTGGLGFIGSIYDFFTLPGQVRDANLRETYRASLAGAYYAGIRAGSPPPDAMNQSAKSTESIERVILRTAKKNNGLATPSEVALEGDIPIEKAKQSLEKLAQDGHCELKVTREGVIIYLFPEFRAISGGGRSGTQEPEFEDLSG